MTIKCWYSSTPSKSVSLYFTRQFLLPLTLIVSEAQQATGQFQLIKTEALETKSKRNHTEFEACNEQFLS